MKRAGMLTINFDAFREASSNLRLHCQKMVAANYCVKWNGSFVFGQHV